MDENNKEYTAADEKETVEPAVSDDATVAAETELLVEEIIIKKKKKKRKKSKNNKTYDRRADDKKSQIILVILLIVGICLFSVSLFGLLTSVDDDTADDVVAETTTETSNQSTPVQPDNTPDETTTANNQTEDNVDGNGGNSADTNADANEDVNDNSNEDANADSNKENNTTAATKSDEELLAMFNKAVNALKTDGPSFSKSKRTQTADIQLSNPLAQAYVSVAKDKYLSDETVVTDVKKGDKANAVAVVSPDGENYVSKLTMGDIKSISHTVKSDGNYEITINMPDATNPDLASSYGKVFEFMLIDDVMNTYAPNMGATVDRANVTLKYTGCYAKAVVTPDGKLVSYETKVNANMILKDAKISVVTTDLDVVLFSDTSYTKIVW